MRIIPHISETKYNAEHFTILRATVGSNLHGLSVPGTDDTDEMGICVEPPDVYMGLKKFEQYVFRTQPEGARSGPGDLDLTIYGLKKYCSLAAKGNPSIIVLMYVPIEDYLFIGPTGASLVRNRDMFVSKRIIRSYLGYMTAQKERLFGERGQKRVNRPELVEKYGFDTKYAMHALRLGHQGVEFSQTGALTLPMREPERTILYDVRIGKYKLEDIKEMYNILEHQLKVALDYGTLPDEPDWDKINLFLIKTYTEFWKGHVYMDRAMRTIF